MTCLDANGKEKSAYESKGTAERFKQKRLRANPTLDLRVYRCPECGKWHMTSRPDRNEEAA